MIVGSVPIFDGPVSRYVARTGVPMLSVQYRLAPEHPFPAGVDDCLAAYRWLLGQGVAARNIVVEPSPKRPFPAGRKISRKGQGKASGRPPVL